MAYFGTTYRKCVLYYSHIQKLRRHFHSSFLLCPKYFEVESCIQKPKLTVGFLAASTHVHILLISTIKLYLGYSMCIFIALNLNWWGLFGYLNRNSPGERIL